MSYRVLLITSAYEEFLEYFFKNAGLSQTEGFDALYERFWSFRFSSSNYHSFWWKTLGVEAWEVCVNIETFQVAWAKEQEIPFEAENWKEEILLAQIKHFNPDVIYIDDLYFVDSKLRAKIRGILPRVVLTGWRFAPTPDFSVLKDIDFIFTGSKEWQNDFLRNNIQAHFVPLCFEHTLLEDIDTHGARPLPFTFVGSTGSPHDYHSERYNLIRQLMEETPLEVWTTSSDNRYYNKALSAFEAIMVKLYGTAANLGMTAHTASQLPGFRKGAYIQKEREPVLHNLFPGRVHKPVFGLENYRILSSSQLTFNIHINVAGKHAGNVRLFEATGMGACLVTDWKENIADLFIPDEEIVTYKSKDEAVEKIKFLLNNEQQRKSIGLKGQQKTLSKYTYKNRISQLHDIISSYLKKR